MTTVPLLRLEQATTEHTSGGHVRRVVDEVSLDVAAGELVALMGPSGSGKTSVIHLACGLLAPSHGHVAVDGQVVAPTDRQRWSGLRRTAIGVVHQHLDLLDGLSVLDNVALPLLLDRRGVRRAHDDARRALAAVDLAGAEDRMPDELSGGERQRVAIARAVVGPRRLVLADEPTAALDTVTAEAIVRLLGRLAEGGAAVLMATHDTRLAGWADRVVALRDGRVVDPARRTTPTPEAAR
ncbi:MAG TPA: ABC transporter ATP-binding protein [Iamia sp.]